MHSGGIFRDMTIHDFDVARWLLGEEVEKVQAAASVLVDPEIGKRGDFDSANVILTTASGRQCTISNSRRAAYGYDQRIEVLGSKGTVSADNHREANIEIGGRDGHLRPQLLNFFMTRYTAAYAAEIAAFVEALAGGTPPPTTGHDGLMALALAEAAVELGGGGTNGPSSGDPRMTRNLDLITIGRSSVDLYGDQIGGRLEDMGSLLEVHRRLADQHRLRHRAARAEVGGHHRRRRRAHGPLHRRAARPRGRGHARRRRSTPSG